MRACVWERERERLCVCEKVCFPSFPFMQEFNGFKESPPWRTDTKIITMITVMMMMVVMDYDANDDYLR